MKAIVLCGGLGTRLGDLTRETPKPLVLVAGRPFLAYVLDQLLLAQIDEIVLAVSFQWQKVQAIIGDNWNGIKVSYSVEPQALGTGGAIRYAMQQSNINEALVVNGDTLLKFNALDLLRFAQDKNADIAIALQETEDTARFGRVTVNEVGRIIAFEEKDGQRARGLINSGVYYIKDSVFATIDPPVFSFEKDVLAPLNHCLAVYGMATNAYFVDMGVPEDLARARVDLQNDAADG